MKKQIFLVFIFLIFTVVSFAQVEITSGGSSTAYTLNVPGVFPLRNGLQVTFKAHLACSASPTINVTGTGAIQIRKQGNTTPLSAGDILANQIVTLVYDGAFWQMISPLGSSVSIPTSYWDPNGIDIFNNNSGGVAIGTNQTFGSKLRVSGNEVTFDNNATGIYLTSQLSIGDGFNWFSYNAGGGPTGAPTMRYAFSPRNNANTGTATFAEIIQGKLANSDAGYISFTTRDSANNLAERMRINSNGNMGVGTTTPTNALSFGNTLDRKIWIESSVGSTVGRDLTISSGSAGGGFNNINGGNMIIQAGVGTGSGSSSILFQNGTTLGNSPTVQTMSTKMIILGNGNVGIGLVNPSQRLHVDGNFHLAFAFMPGGNAGTSGQILTSQGPGNPPLWQNATSQGLVSGSGIATRVAFWDGTSSLSSNANLYWDNTNSRLGIGTATPVKRLQVENANSGVDTLGNIAVYHNSSSSGVAFSAIANNTGTAGGTTIFAQTRLAAYSPTPLGTIDYGIYARSSGWAGLFDNTNRPNSYVGIGGGGSGNNLAVNHTTSLVTDAAQVNTYTYNGIGAGINTGLRINATNNTTSNSVNVHGVYAAAVNNSTGSNASAVGVGGYVTGSNTIGEKTGIEGSATGVGNINIGVLGNASGATNNWAGYFLGGDVYIQNNIGAGTTAPQVALHVSRNSSLGRIRASTHWATNNAGGAIDMAFSRGTAASPSVVISGDALGFLNFMGYNGASYQPGAWIKATTSENWTATGNGTQLEFMTRANGSTLNPTRMIITNAGNVGIGTANPDQLLSVNGNASKIGGGTWVAFSDARLKKEIEPFNKGLEVIKALTPVSFKYNEMSGHKDLNKKFIGFIAQEVEAIAPYMVETFDDSKGPSGLKDKRVFDESALSKIMVNAIKEQQQQIESQQKTIEELIKRIEALEKK